MFFNPNVQQASLPFGGGGYRGSPFNFHPAIGALYNIAGFSNPNPNGNPYAIHPLTGAGGPSYGQPSPALGMPNSVPPAFQSGRPQPSVAWGVGPMAAPNPHPLNTPIMGRPSPASQWGPMTANPSINNTTIGPWRG
jgi:hypothetical protein